LGFVNGHGVLLILIHFDSSTGRNTMKNLIPRIVQYCSVACLLMMWLVSPSSTSASLVEYCDVVGSHVSFGGLVETSTGAGGPMYGQPISDGDDLVAPALGFLAQSAGGGIQLVDGRLQMTITAEPGFVFDEINVAAFGSYFGIGADAMAMFNSFASVESDGQVFTGGTTASQNGTAQAGWQDDYSIQFAETDQVTLTLNTQLLAASGMMSAAFIETSSIRVSVNSFAASIPEPSAAWCCLLFAVVLHRRRPTSR